MIDPNMLDPAEAARLLGQYPILKFFAYGHLPERLAEVSTPFAKLAFQLASGPANVETSTALRKLLEARDAALRAAL